MFKNGKLFGKINMFDALILIIVVALVVAGITKFRTFNQTVDTSLPGKITYEFLISNVRDYTLKSFQSGDEVYDEASKINIGKIVSIDSRDAKVIKSFADGSTEIVQNPYRKDVILTIETPGSETENAYFANKSIELKVGSEKKIETLYASSYGKISKISYEK